MSARVIHSRKGKAYAQNAIVQSISDRDVPLVFVDADVRLDKDCTRILYDDLKAIDKLVVVGAWPIPARPYHLTPWEHVMFRVLHMRAFYSEAEMSVHDVTRFKEYARARPQSSMDPDSEMRTKIFFHGRMFIQRMVQICLFPRARK